MTGSLSGTLLSSSSDQDPGAERTERSSQAAAADVPTGNQRQTRAWTFSGARPETGECCFFFFKKNQIILFITRKIAKVGVKTEK